VIFLGEEGPSKKKFFTLPPPRKNPQKMENLTLALEISRIDTINKVHWIAEVTIKNNGPNALTIFQQSIYDRPIHFEINYHGSEGDNMACGLRFKGPLGKINPQEVIVGPNSELKQKLSLEDYQIRDCGKYTVKAIYTDLYDHTKILVSNTRLINL
jgi:hypothetical protein